MINQSNKTLNTNITKLVNQPYKYGFSTDIENFKAPKGLSEKTIKFISEVKKEVTCAVFPEIAREVRF